MSLIHLILDEVYFCSNKTAVEYLIVVRPKCYISNVFLIALQEHKVWLSINKAIINDTF